MASPSDETPAPMDDLVGAVEDLQRRLKTIEELEPLSEAAAQPITITVNNKGEILLTEPIGGIGVIGQLIAVSPPTNAGGTGANALAVSPDGKNVYVSGETDESLRVYTRASNGVLHFLELIEKIGNQPRWITVSPGGLAVYVAIFGTGKIRVYKRNPETGALTFAESVATLESPVCIAMSPDGKSLYVSATGGAASSGIQAFEATPEGSIRSVGVEHYENGQGVVVSPDGLNVYAIATPGTGIIRVYERLESGALVKLEEIGIGASENVNGIAIDPQGNNVYAPAEHLKQFARLPSGKLSALTPAEITVGLPNERTNLVVSVNRHNVYLTNNARITQVARSVTTGTLALMPTELITTGAHARQIVVSPDGLNVYVTNSEAGTVSTYSLN